MLKKLAIAAMAAASLLALSPANAQSAAQGNAQNFPSQPVRIVVPFTAGGASDIVARLLGQRLSEIWKQAVIIDNRPGASGVIGNEYVKRSAPDGYTLLLGGPSSLTGLVAVNSKVPYDPITDFSDASVVATFPSALAINPAIAKTLPELIALLKANPGKYSYSSSGSGTSTHLIAELFKSMTGTDILHIPYPGSGPALNAVMAGTVSMSFAPINAVVPLVQANRLAVLGVTSPKRAEEFPNTPAIGELVKGFSTDSWIGILAPANTPAPILNRISEGVRQAVQSPEIVNKFKEMNVTPVGGTPKEMSEFIKADLATWKQVVKVANIKVD